MIAGLFIVASAALLFAIKHRPVRRHRCRCGWWSASPTEYARHIRNHQDI